VILFCGIRHFLTTTAGTRDMHGSGKTNEGGGKTNEGGGKTNEGGGKTNEGSGKINEGGGRTKERCLILHSTSWEIFYADSMEQPS